MTDSFLLNEIYPCLQGEGPCLGIPSILVRFQICNLRCTWCDTPYTHTVKSDPAREAAFLVRLTCAELMQHIQAFPQRHVILSGGEPTLQNIGPVLRALGLEGYSCEVETNGTRIPHRQFSGFLESDYQLSQWNVSPKFSNAGAALVPEAMAHWSALGKTARVFFKFVVRKLFLREDLAVITWILETYAIAKNQVILMPEGTHSASQLNNEELYDVCLQQGFRYTPRLHVLTFENKRGV